jgi:hypothetical protein
VSDPRPPDASEPALNDPFVEPATVREALGSAAEPAMTAAPEPVPQAAPSPVPQAAPSPAPAAGPPVAPVWPRVGAVLSGAFDIVTQARGPLRNASLYIGLLGLLTMGPALIAIVADPAFSADFATALPSEQPGLDLAALYLLLFALVAVALESQIIGLAVVGGARTGRPLSLREGLRRSRTAFWRMFRATALLTIVDAILSQVILGVLSPVFGPDTDVPVVGTNLIVGVILAPFVYVAVGIVLGDVGTVEAIRRSVRLARARFRLALVLSIFSVVANYLLLFAASAGLDLAARILEPFSAEIRSLDPGNLAGFMLGAAVILLALFAGWTLVFSVGALTSATQVVAFLGLTGYSGGLDKARDEVPGEPLRERPSWVSRPMIAGIVIGLLLASGSILKEFG